MSAGLTERDLEILRELDAANRNHARYGFMGGWARPLDCGGSNGSDHSYRLAKLVKLGLAESRQRSGFMSRGSKVYRVTEAGLTLLPPHRSPPPTMGGR